MATSDIRELGFYIPNWMEDDSFLGSPYLFAYGGELTFSLGETFTQEDLIERLEDLHIHISELEDSGQGTEDNVFYSTFTFERACLNEALEKLDGFALSLVYVADGGGDMAALCDELGSSVLKSRTEGSVTIDDQKFLAIS